MTDINSQEKSAVPLNIFWLGFLIYVLSNIIAQAVNVNYALFNLFQLIGIILFIPSTIFLIQIKIDNKYLGTLYAIFLLWNAVVIIRGIKLDYASMKVELFHPIIGVFPYLVPVVLLFPRSPVFIKKMFQVIILMGIIYIILCFAFIKDLLIKYNDIRSLGLSEAFTQDLALQSGFILFTTIYHSRKRKWFSLFVMIVAFLLAVIRARRGLMFLTFSILCFSYLFYQYVNKTKVIYIIISFFFIVLLSAAAVKIYTENRKDTFGLITERIGKETRSAVENYFYRDLKSKDWLIGKGINGQYFCPGVTEGVGRMSVYRSVIETGYLQIILNGGIISLVLLLLIMIPAVVKGLFYSKNLLSKAAAAWIVLFFLYEYPGLPSIFSFNYVLVWISIGICYLEDIRQIPESEMMTMLCQKDPHVL
jgi:hypothetical protein